MAEINNGLDEFLKSFSSLIQQQSVLGMSLFRGESRQYEAPLMNGLSRQYPWTEINSLKMNDYSRLQARKNTAMVWLNKFKREAYPFLDKESTPTSELEWYILAQHYRFPTPLLDWTTNPLVALFFAIEKHDGEDGHLFYIELNGIIDELDDVDIQEAQLKSLEKELYQVMLLEADEAYQVTEPDYYGNALFIRPKYTDRRYLNQSTVLMLPKNPFEQPNYLEPKVLTIPKELKVELRRYLRALQITHSFIYPSLEGAAETARLAVNEEAIKIRLF